ncbi:hypothetical protein CCACVL1_20305 [Corchorus capsularis]|uniref:Uncharacterized protein n=1 Tax=Corchorus capsularis TaxID=210143 RepID=A0A1R3HBU9_COCAP|nr:hypothetical protein CCACVL1_20305 [Corchorus capsularis]
MAEVDSFPAWGVMVESRSNGNEFGFSKDGRPKLISLIPAWGVMVNNDGRPKLISLIPAWGVMVE